MNRNDGGPAFPARPAERLVSGDIVSANEGMTLRDWFAGQALNGMIASSEDFTASTGAKVAYDFADAMLKAREQ